MIGKMLGEHWFWGALTLAVLLWYSTVTIYVAIRGVADIRQMLRRLGERQAAGREASDADRRRGG